MKAPRFPRLEKPAGSSHHAGVEPAGEIDFLNGRWAQAYPALRERARSAPAEAGLRFKLAWCATKLDCPEEAVAWLQGLSPREAQAELLYGRALLACGRARPAIDALVASGMPAADLELGFAHYVLGQREQAKAAWSRWLRAGAADWGIKDALARFLALLDGGPLPQGEIERPEEPLAAMAAWAGILARYGLADEVERLAGSGPRLGARLWGRWRPKLEARLASAGSPAVELPPGPVRPAVEPPGA